MNKPGSFRLVLCLALASLLIGCRPGLKEPSHPASPSSGSTSGTAKNVILVIGDGMGTEAVYAGSLFAHGQKGKLSFESFPQLGTMTHNSAGDVVTDSAAAATAMATGVKVTNGVVSVELPGNGRDLPTLLETLQGRGYRVGLVTNSFVEDATPAAFAAHDANRGHVESIARDYLQDSRPDVLMGGYCKNGVEPEVAAGAGYEVVETKEQLQAFANSNPARLAGLFGKGHLPYELDGDFQTIPRLSEMTAKAVRVLGNANQPFFLLVENENIDEAGHANNIERQVRATAELSNAVEEVLDWLGARNDTLIIVTADHETGGLNVSKGMGQGVPPKVSWSTNGHTSMPVPVFATGPGAENLSGPFDNVELPTRILKSLGG